MKIAVIKNVLGAEVGAYAEDEFADACEWVCDGDAVVMFADGLPYETLKGAEFKKFYEKKGEL